MRTSQHFSLAPAISGLIALVGVVTTAQAQDEQGRVISAIPVVQQVAVPRQVCIDQTVSSPGQKSGAGALIGAIAGGAMGNAVGDGNGRALATVIGLVGGAMVGDRIEGGGQPEMRNVQRCSTQTFYENRAVAYDVTYEYAGRQYRTQMAQDPGPFVRLNVTPVNSVPPPVQYLPAQPRVEYIPTAPAVTRIQIGTSYVPVAGVVYAGGYRQTPVHRHPHFGYGNQARHEHWRERRDGRDEDRWIHR